MSDIFLKNILAQLDKETEITSTNINQNSITSSANMSQLIGGGSGSVTSSYVPNQMFLSETSNQMIGGNNASNDDISKLLSMLTTETSTNVNEALSETSTNSLEQQLRDILQKNGGSKSGCSHCGGSSGISSSDIRGFFSNLKNQGVDVNIRLNNQSMSEYFAGAQETTTDINSQDGGANNKFAAATAIRKDIAKEFNIPNGKDVVKVAFAVIKDVLKDKETLINDVPALTKAAKKHFEENTAHYKRMI